MSCSVSNGQQDGSMGGVATRTIVARKQDARADRKIAVPLFAS